MKPALLFSIFLFLPLRLVCQQSVDIRSELTRIDLRHARNFDDYLSRSNKVRLIIPRLEDFYRHSNETIQRLKKEHSDNPQFVKLADFYSQVNAADEEGLQVLQQEVTLASQMSSMTANERQAFYDHRIVPLQHREDEISNRETRMAIDARANGIPLPDDVASRLPRGK